jgi:porin
MLFLGTTAPAFAEEALAAPAADAGHLFNFSGELTVDGIAILQGGAGHRVRELDLLSLGVSADFSKIGWTGGSGQLTFQNSSGAQPNIDLGTLEGVSNAEVVSRRGRLFEGWLQQDFGNDKGSIQAGLINFNADFDVTDSAGLLIAPTYGIESELAASGPGGPPSYPTSSLGARLAFKPTKNTYLMVGAFNATLGAFGDPGGVDTAFDQGVFEVIEGGWKADGNKIGVAGWRYSKKQDDLFDTVGGVPVQRTPSGAYVIAERVLLDGGDKGASFTGFLRAGFSDGNTGPLKSDWQFGGLLTHVFASRPDSQFSFGVDQASLGNKFRKASASGGTPLGSTETHLEVTYADSIGKHVVIQPDLQYILDPGGDKAAKSELVFQLRLKGSF